MSTVVFYEKPGCITNARQKALLLQHGCRLTVRNLLAEPWTRSRLRAFVADRPVVEWFNPSAPAIKSGEIDPAALDRESAIDLLLGDLLLIRRPLLDTEYGKAAGFDDTGLLVRLGVPAEAFTSRVRDCARPSQPAGCDAAG